MNASENPNKLSMEQRVRIMRNVFDLSGKPLGSEDFAIARDAINPR